MRDNVAKSIVFGLALLAAMSGCAGRDCWADHGFFGFCVPDVEPTTAAEDAGSQGACLLEYNSALADGDPCCFYEGGHNSCDRAIACNERSGADCCQIYDVEHSACCQYESGRAVDESSRCRMLLDMSR